MLSLQQNATKTMQNIMKSIRSNVLRSSTLAVASLLLLTIAIVPFARADQYQDEIDALRAQNESTEHEVNALELFANDIQDAINKLQATVNELEAQIVSNTTKREQLKQDIKAAEIELARQRDILGQNIKAMYIEGDISTLEQLATSNDLSQFVDKQQYRNVVQSKIKSQVDEITRLRLALQTQKEEVERLIKEDEELRAEIQAQKAEQNRLLQLNLAEQAEFNAKIKENNKKILELRQAQEQLAAALRAGNYKVAPAGYVNGGDIIGNVGNTGLSTGAHLHLEVRINGGVANPGPYIKNQPVVPTYVAQSYGNRDPIYVSGYHPGIDYARGDGAIHAIDSGNLYRGCSNDLLGTSNNPYGYVAIVEHEGGHVSVYGHMSGGPAACNYNTYY